METDKIDDLKECFIIMPISNNTNYPDGHFDRVYKYLINPACELAGFKAIRADEVNNTNYIALDIIKRIINSDMAICDLSSQNPNVLYELGIRQAFNKPVTLIKDKVTKRIFDIQGFRDFEYDSNLRVDNIEREIESLSELIKNTYESQGSEINSLTALLSLSPAKLQENKEISAESELILNAISSMERRILSMEKASINSLNTHNRRILIGDDKPVRLGEVLTISNRDELQIGDKVYHEKYGIGEIFRIREDIQELSQYGLIINFEQYGRKNILLKYGRLRKVLDEN